MKLNEFKRMIRPYAGRVKLETFINILFPAVLFGACGGLCVLISSFFMPYKITLAASVLSAVGVMLASIVVLYIIKRPDLRTIARRLDSAGFENRAETCFELISDNSVMATFQRRDTERFIKRMKPASIKLKIDYKRAIACLLSILIFVGCMFIPNANLKALAKQEELEQKQLDTIEEAVEKLEDAIKAADLSEENEEAALKELSDLKKTLEKTNDLSKRLAAINEAKQAINDILEKDKKEKALKALEKAAEALEKSQSEEMQNLGKASKEADEKDIEKAIDDLKEKINSGAIDEKTIEEMKKAADDAAKAAGENSLSDAYKDLAEKLEALKNAQADSADKLEKAEEAKKSLEKLEDELKKYAGGETSDSSDTQKISDEMLDKLKKDLAQQQAESAEQGSQTTPSGNNVNSSANSSGTTGKRPSGSSGVSSSSSQPRQQSSSATGSSSQSPDNQQTDPGSGGSTGGSGGEPGASGGDTPGGGGDQSGTGGSQGGGAGRGEGGVKSDTERVYTGDVDVAEGGDSEYVPGKTDDNGNPQRIEMGEKEATDATVPYGEVFNEYAQKATESMDRENIPDTLREIIEKYFSELS